MGLFSNPARDEQGNELKRRRTDQIPFSIIASDMTAAVIPWYRPRSRGGTRSPIPARASS